MRTEYSGYIHTYLIFGIERQEMLNLDGISDFASTWNIVRTDRERQRKRQKVTPVHLPR